VAAPVLDICVISAAAKIGSASCGSGEEDVKKTLQGANDLHRAETGFSREGHVSQGLHGKFD